MGRAGDPAGSVSVYTSTVWGIDSRCGGRVNLGDLSLVGTDRLNDATSEAVPLDPDIQEWRKTATINSYGRLDSSGPDSDLIFGLA